MKLANQPISKVDRLPETNDAKTHRGSYVSALSISEQVYLTVNIWPAFLQWGLSEFVITNAILVTKKESVKIPHILLGQKQANWQSCSQYNLGTISSKEKDGSLICGAGILQRMWVGCDVVYLLQSVAHKAKEISISGWRAKEFETIALKNSFSLGSSFPILS